MFSNSSSYTHSTNESFLTRLWRQQISSWKVYCEKNEIGGAYLVYVAIIVAIILTQTIVIPAVKIEYTVTTDADGTVVDQAITANNSTFITHHVPYMIGTITVTQFLHIAYAILPIVIIANIWLCRSISPGYVQTLSEIAERDRCERLRREQDRLAKLAAADTTTTLPTNAAVNGNGTRSRALHEDEESKESEHTDTDDEHSLLQSRPSAGSIPPPPPSPPTIPSPSATRRRGDSPNGVTQSNVAVHQLDQERNDEKFSLNLTTNESKRTLQVQPQSDDIHLTIRDQNGGPVTTNGASKQPLPSPTIRESTPTYCSRCDSARPPRAGHCSSCHTCVLVFDHHCGVIGCCIGQYNYRFFFWFLFWAALAIAGAVTLALVWLFQIPFYDPAAWSEPSVYLAGAALCGYLCLGGLPSSCFLIHCFLICQNLTVREHTGKQKIKGTISFWNCCIRPWSDVWCQPLVWRDDNTPNDTNTREFKLSRPPVRSTAAATSSIQTQPPIRSMELDVKIPIHH